METATRWHGQTEYGKQPESQRPPNGNVCAVSHICVLLPITSMQPQLRLHVASGSVNCSTISQVANLLVVQETAVLDWTDEISICQLLLHSLLETQG